MTAYWLTGDTRAVMAQLPAGSVDLVLTSPPFLALRSYLEADDPAKVDEIGSEANPAEFIDTLLDVTEACARLLAPHGTLCVELGDTYAGSGGAGGDYGPSGAREGQPTFSATKNRRVQDPHGGPPVRALPHGGFRQGGGDGWPLPKSLALIPEAYRMALAYGRNPHNGRLTDPWRIRNVIRWVRPNPPVGALGDKFRPATSEMVVACKSAARWFDLDAVRTPLQHPDQTATTGARSRDGDHRALKPYDGSKSAGAPPLDWWKISPKGYSGTTSTKKRVRCGPDDGGERTTSPDCPVHADLPGQLPKALRDARAEAQSNHTERSNGHPDPGQRLDFGTTGSTPGHSDSVPARTSAPSDPQGLPSATPRSTASRRTDPVPATSSPGTPSARTAGGTARTSTSPESSAPHPGKPESSTSGQPCPTESDLETGSSTEDTPSEPSACTCSFWRTETDSTSHYATWPPELCVRPIEAMCPRRVCLTCGKPSRRLTTAEYVKTQATSNPSARASAEGVNAPGADQTFVHGRADKHVQTTGWSSCDCPDTDGIRLDGYHTGTGWRAGIVLDPFGGSGTTAAVASGHSRDSISIDLDRRNADLARARIGMWFQELEPADLGGAA